MMHLKTDTNPNAFRANHWSPKSYVRLTENRSAVLALRRLARRLGLRCPFVPLFLYGPSGSGKTHLTDQLFEWAAATYDVRRQDAADWSTLEEFFPDELRGCDLLIIEDLQHLPERAASIFTALLDRRIAHQQPTIITANRGPAELESLPSRLASRLYGGLVVGIESLGFASRKRFLEKQAQMRGLIVRPDVIAWLAANTPGSARPLLAALLRLGSLSEGKAKSPNLAVVKAHFEADSRSITLDRIVQLVGRHYRVEPRVIRGVDQHPGVVWARQVSMQLARTLTPLSVVQIGIYFGRDQSTVRHSCRRVEESIDSDPEQAALLRQLSASLLV